MDRYVFDVGAAAPCRPAQVKNWSGAKAVQDDHQQETDQCQAQK